MAHKGQLVSCHGCKDESNENIEDKENLSASYTHIYGQKYRAPLFLDTESIGAKLLKKADKQKKHYLKIKKG